MSNFQKEAMKPPKCTFYTVEGGTITKLSGSVKLQMAHEWMEHLVAMTRINWSILDVRELQAVESGVWPILQMGIKKMHKKGMKRFLIVVENENTFKVMQSCCKQAGVFGMAEYFDAKNKTYNQAKVVDHLKTSWDKK